MFFYKIILFLLNFINITYSFNLCIVGASSGLGRELIYQGIEDKNLKILGLTTKSEIYEPYRGNSFEDRGNNILYKNNNLVLVNYWDHITSDYDNIVFCTSARPFGIDYSDKLTEKFLCHLSDKCKTIHLISAYGVGDSLNNSNLGIKVMDSLYLKDVYRAKNTQEKLLHEYKGNVEKFIYRPKALSYGDTFINSIKRKDLASQILNKIYK